MIIAALFASLGFAGEPSFEHAAAEEEREKPETSFKAELGGNYTSGNAVNWSVIGGVDVGHFWKSNKLTFLLNGTLSQSINDIEGDGKLTEEERDAGLRWSSQSVTGRMRYDRFFNANDAIYVMVDGQHDRFAGLTYRFSYQAGYARKIVDTEKTLFNTEVGLNYVQEKFTESPEETADDIFDNQYLAGRIMLGLQYKFNDNVAFIDTFETYINFFEIADLRLYNTATLSVSLTSAISLNLSNKLAFDNVPVEGFRKLDQTTQLTFVAAIL